MKGKMQYFVIFISIIALLLFLAPIVTGTVNIGNLTGIVVFGALLCYGFFMKRVHVWIGKLWQHTGGKLLLGAACILLLAIVITAGIETVCMVRAAENRPPENVTAIVLGCSVKGNRPSRILAERIEAAFEYLQENPEAVCILSGGKGSGENISEAECMYEALTRMGIDGERLILEEKSTSTEENLKFSGEILTELGLGNEVVIITSEFHAYRAGVIAERLGLESYSVPGHTFFPFLPAFYVRELYAILQQWIFK